ncbi:glycosyltransferase [Methanobrevibacter sp. OttesenSCG-928-K11]|nr:glycosyltransferase [Methanobrevibacter sp. OttesenSCG-928-K11]MDL2270400.1 glycosyltransferase [Methanobrevibacter sp. OttesenSCG-928-I08]
MSYKISVIIPVYNSEKYIKQCLDSVVNQTLGIKNIEVIIINDCTLDNSMDIVNEYSNKYSSFKVIKHDKNKGLGEARNTGLKHVSTNFVTFLDSDDYISLNAYKDSLNKMKKNNCDLLVFNSQIFSDVSKNLSHDIHQFNIDNDMIINDLNDIPQLIFSTSAWNKIFSKKLFENLVFPNKLYEDNHVIINSLFDASKIYLNSNVNYFYRKNEGGPSITTNITLKNCIDLADEIISLFSLENKYPAYSNLLRLLNLKFTQDILFWLVDKISFNNEENEILNKIRPFLDKFSKEDMITLKKLFPEQVSYNDLILNSSKYDNDFLLAKYKYFDNLKYLSSKAYLYVDTGNDFNEDEKIVIDYQLDFENKFKIDLNDFKNIKRLRFDPIKQSFIKCKINSVKTDIGDMVYEANSYEIIDEYYYFSNISPYFVLNNNLKDLSFLEIDFTLYFLNNDEINYLFDKKDIDINNKNIKIEQLVKEINKLVRNKLFNY